MLAGDHAITELLGEWRAGDHDALARLMPLLYEEMRRLAASCLRNSDPVRTLQPTALVHEFYLRASGLQTIDWENRAHFIGTAARVMRNIVVDDARRRGAAKRGAGLQHSAEADLAAEEPLVDVLAVDQALGRFETEYPRHAKVVELMFFGGLTAEETAHVLSAQGSAVSSRTVERDWRFARAWLHHELASPLP